MANGTEYRLLKFNIPATAADETIYDLWDYPQDGVIESVTYVPDDAVTANDTNYANFTLSNATVSVTIATFSTETSGSGGTGNQTAGTAIAVSLSASGAGLDLVEDDVLSFAKVDSGSGVTAGGSLIVKVRLNRN
ncbi:MAG: hypothetical protein AAFV53_28875 [Myxococcota bacterium]